MNLLAWIDSFLPSARPQRRFPALTVVPTPEPPSEPVQRLCWCCGCTDDDVYGFCPMECRWTHRARVLAKTAKPAEEQVAA